MQMKCVVHLPRKPFCHRGQPGLAGFSSGAIHGPCDLTANRSRPVSSCRSVPKACYAVAIENHFPFTAGPDWIVALHWESRPRYNANVTTGSATKHSSQLRTGPLV